MAAIEGIAWGAAPGCASMRHAIPRFAMPRLLRLTLLPAAALAVALLGAPGTALAQGATAIPNVSSSVGGTCTRFVVRGLSAAADRRSLTLDYDVAGLPPDNIAQFDVTVSVTRGGTTVRADAKVTWRGNGAGSVTIRPASPLPADLSGASATVRGSCSGRPGGMGGGF